MANQVKQGINDLYTWCINNGDRGKQLISEWVGLDENGEPVDINCVSRGTAKQVQWKCEKGHLFTAKICSRTAQSGRSRGTNCPYCTRSPKVVLGDNDLYTWCTKNDFGKNILAEWTGKSIKGEDFDIHNVSFGSNKEMYWKCQNGHLYTNTIKRKTYQHLKCTYCSHQKLSNETSLQYYFDNNERGKLLQQEWLGLDENNNKVYADKIFVSSNIRVKWKCSKCNNTYTTLLASRTHSKSNCPYCNNKIITDENSLLKWCKDNPKYGDLLLTEWIGSDENGNSIDINKIPKSSSIKAGWKCSKGHVWYAYVYNRVYYDGKRGVGCPYCNKIGTSYPEQLIYHALKQILPNAVNRFKTAKTSKHKALEFDIAIPLTGYSYKGLCIEYSPTYWHIGREHIDNEKKQLCIENNIRLIQIIDDSYDELEHVWSDNYICDNIERSSNRQDILVRIIKFIVKTLNIDYHNIDFYKAEKDAIESKTGSK